MKSFLLQLLLFLVIFWCSDQVVSKVLEQFRPIDYRLFLEAKQELFKDTNRKYQILLLGDSHIADGLDPRVLEAEGRVAAFNLGVYHASPYEWYYLFLASLRTLESQPRYLVIGTNPDMFIRNVDVGKYTHLIIDDPYTEFQLYYNSDGGVNRSYFIKTLQERYLFSSVINCLIGKEYKATRVINDISNGYLATVNQTSGLDWELDKSKSTKSVNYEQVSYFAKTIEVARSFDVRVIIVNLPIWDGYLKIKEQQEFFKNTLRIVDSTAMIYNVPVFNQDYEVLRSVLTKDDYLNPEHLNSFGAQKFSVAFFKWFMRNDCLLRQDSTCHVIDF